MKVHELEVVAAKDKKRVGRGIGSGYGKTAGRGTKGQNARTGGGVRPGFEGGQNPLAKRLPKKRGFASLNRISYQVVNLSSLDKFNAGDIVGIAELVKAGLVKYSDRPVKILAQGVIAKKLIISVQAASLKARDSIVKAGGSIALAPLPRPKPKAKV